MLVEHFVSPPPAILCSHDLDNDEFSFFEFFVSQSMFEIQKLMMNSGSMAKILEFQCHITAGKSSHDFVLRLYESCVGGQSKRFIHSF